MQPEELDAIAETIVETVKGQTAPMVQRLDALALREPAIGPPGPPGKDGCDGTAGVDAPIVDIQEVAKQAAALLPIPKDGRDGADADAEFIVSRILGSLTDQIAVLVTSEVMKAVSAIEKPKDGSDGLNGKDGRDGQSVTVDEIAPLVSVEVAKAVGAIERPKDGENGRDGVDGKDGQSITIEQVSSAIVAEVTKAVEAIPRPKDGTPGRDGVGVAGALIDNAGALVLTLSNGTLQPLGTVVGTKGEPGANGRDGKDGADGFGFDDLSVDYDGDQTVSLAFKQGERVKAFPVTFPFQIHKGVFDVTKTYERGQCTTWGGSTWQAVRQTSGIKPGDGSTDKTGWVLVTKKGSDGRNGKDGEPGKPGRDGKDGGQKW